MKQISFFKNQDFPKEFGGILLKNKRKTKRPLSTKKPTHLILKSESKSLRMHRQKIYSSFDHFAKKFGVKIYKKGLASDHVHSMISFKSTDDYKAFSRAVTGVLTRSLKIKWILRPFTRVVEWGRDFRKACAYVFQNELEGLGLIPYRVRGRHRARPG